MNLRTIGMAYKAASLLYGRYRDMNDEQQRDVYEAMRALARPASVNEKGEPFDVARLQAGELTRVAHDRLDARRAEFRQAQLEKEAKKAAAKLDKKAGKAGKAKRKKGGTVRKLGLLAGIAGAVWYFFFRDTAPKPTTSVRVTTSDTYKGPLGEEMTSLDTLADDQRAGTQPRDNM
ncbi:hypothetical protein [Corynebacterium meitnerae]|uniref:Uncharacterized protein n=1 Tax=Corynebacterium meitnerae TaxID=2913498 RepID=A0A9X3LU69_9CORY|nr:hypothetical protein [Corynebacterium meitnerae]MCZ9294311.1 hypothetical protein [Corynebacterium meitnerae]